MIAYLIFHAVIFLLYFLPFAGLACMLYLIPTIFGYPRVGKILGGIVGAFIIGITFFLVFDDQLFSKRDALKMLKSQDIVLNDDFKIKHNRSEANIGDHSQTFTLQISASDKERLVHELMSAKDFNQNSLLPSDHNDQNHISKRIEIHDTETHYIIEICERPEGGLPSTYTTIKINKKNNLLIFDYLVM